MLNAWLPLQHLNRAPIRVGGLCYFYFTPIENVLQFPEINPVNGACIGDVVLKENTKWYRCEVINPKKTYTEKNATNEAGGYMQCQLTGFLPDDMPNIAYSLNEMRYHKYAIVLVERNGMKRLVGNQFYAANFAFDYDSADDSGVRGRSLTFSWLSEDTAPVYTNDIKSDSDIIEKPKDGTIYWDFFDHDPGNSGVALSRTFSVLPGSDYTIDTTIITVPSFIYIKEPSWEPAKTRWTNSQFNYGNIPDQVWSVDTGSIPGYRIYKTRSFTSFDAGSKTTFYKS